MRLAIIITHPIQYYAPVFKLLSERQKLIIKVFYTLGEKSGPRYDPGFDKNIEWDIPLLDGYPYEWVKNQSPDPGTHHFRGVVNPNLIEHINSWKPDALLVYGWSFHSHLKVLWHFKNKVPVFFRGDSTLLDEEKGLKSFLRLLVLKQVYKYIDHAFYVGLNNKAYFMKHGLKEGQLSFAPHAVENERFSAEKTVQASSLRNTLGINQEDVLVLYAGKMETKKAPLELMEAFFVLANTNVHLLYVGNGPLENSLKQSASGKKNVHFIDFQNQSEMPVFYHACDLFCLPSTGPGETWGLAVNEAMACKKAVLASDKVGCAIDLVTNGRNGRIFKAGNITDLAETLRQLVTSKAQLAELGQQSGRLIKDWSFLHIAEAIENKLLTKPNEPAKQ